MMGLAWTPYTCITEQRGRVTGVSGFDFEISETYCSTLGESIHAMVYVTRPGHPRKTLLIEYDPMNEETLPVITSVGPNTVLISIAAISELIFRRDGMKGLFVEYDIGRIVFPRAAQKETR